MASTSPSPFPFPAKRIYFGADIPMRLIKRYARAIAEEFKPDMIILFGSHARGDAGPDSDVDLLVVMAVDGSRREKAIEIGVALHGIGYPKTSL